MPNSERNLCILMIASRKQFHLFIFGLIVFSQLLAAEKPVIKKEKLQIVFLFGQSDMVGLPMPELPGTCPPISSSHDALDHL
jgi:hypothetical protein